MTRNNYSNEFKQQALDKVYQRKDCTIADIATELNIKLSTLKQWMKHSKMNLNPPKADTKRPQDWTTQSRLLALQQSYGLAELELSAWCRQQGIFPHHLEQWRKEFCEINTSKSNSNHTSTEETRSLKHRHKQLERELMCKEKALAEAAVLLILQKKFNALLEVEEK